MSRQTNTGEVNTFTNDSAMMIAYERSLETSRDDALFDDPLAIHLAGTEGKDLSTAFGVNCTKFEFPDWSEFHKAWTAVRTRFIDDVVTQLSSTRKFEQLVNLGAGMDTRVYRLECYAGFSRGCFEVDMEVINQNKAKVFGEILGGPSPHCTVHNITLDFLDPVKSLSTELTKPFDTSFPSLFVSEGLVMYLGPEGKLKLLRDLSAVAAVGSVLVLQFMDASESAAAKDNPALLKMALSPNEITSILGELGWLNFEFSKFGDEKLNFGRYPVDRFKPSASFSFVVCEKVG